MKPKLIILAAAALVLSVTGCSKQKSCRCSVLNSSTIRIVTIESGECEQLKEFRYHTMLDSLRVDSLLCTDFEFEIDK